MKLHFLLEQFNPHNQTVAADLKRIDEQIKNIFDERCPKEFQEHPSLMRICRYAINSRAFYTYSRPPSPEEGFSGNNIFLDLENELMISECNCKKSSMEKNKSGYDRLTSKRRDEVESAFLEKFIATHPHKNQPIRIACLGTGFMADTNLLIARMVYHGYTDLEFFCIDRIYAYNPWAQYCFRQVKRTYLNLPDISVKINGLIDVDSVPEIDGFVAVDFDGLFYDLLDSNLTDSLLSIGKIAKNLTKNGIGVLGLKDYGDLFFPNLDETPQTWNTQGIQAIYEDMRKNLPDRKEFNVGIPFSWYGMVPVFLIALVGALKNKEQIPEKIVLSFPSALLPGVQSREENLMKEYPQSIHPREIEERIMTFIKLLLPATEVIVNLQRSKEARFDMILSEKESEECAKDKELFPEKKLLNNGGVLYQINPELEECNVIKNMEGNYSSSKIKHFWS